MSENKSQLQKWQEFEQTAQTFFDNNNSINKIKSKIDNLFTCKLEEKDYNKEFPSSDAYLFKKQLDELFENLHNTLETKEVSHE